MVTATRDTKDPDNLQKLVNDHKTFLSDNYIVSTKGTAEYLHEKTEIVVTDIGNSGQEGGDINIANMVLEGDIDVAIFLLNPILFSALSRCLCIDADVQLQGYPSCNEYEDG